MDTIKKRTVMMKEKKECINDDKTHNTFSVSPFSDDHMTAAIVASRDDFSALTVLTLWNNRSAGCYSHCEGRSLF